MKRFARIWSVLLSALLLMVLCAPLGAAADTEETTVRVGYMDYDGFITPQSDGTYSGYGAEYLTKISEYTNYHYEYVYGQWSDLLQMLEVGDIDLLCTAQYTEERARKYTYSTYPIGYTQGLLYGAADTDIAFEDFEGFAGKQVGVMRDSAMLALFEQYEAYNNFSCSIVEYDSEEDMAQALNDGQIDAMCSEHLANHKGFTLLAAFGADAYYIIGTKNSPYMPEIDSALQQIKTDVDFEAALYHKYYDDSAAETTLQFTKAEAAFIESCDTLVVGVNGDRAPFSTYDEKTDSFHGICIDVLDAVAQASGLQFDYVAQEPGVKTVDMLASGKYDVICGIERDNFTTNEDYCSTDAFLESVIVPVGLAGREYNLSDPLTVAYPASFQALKKELETYYPQLNLVGYALNTDCLDAVQRGDADLFIQNTHLLSQLLQQPKYDGLDILPVNIMTEHTAMALPRTPDSLLLSVLNKAIDNLDPGTISSSLIRNTFASPYEYTLGDLVYKFRLQITIVSVLLLACFALLATVAIIKQRSARKLAQYNVSLQRAMEKADSANVAKTQFLARMSHEIRTPMNAIVGITAIAQHHLGDAGKMADYLGKIETSSRVLLNIINDVLDMSAISTNKLKIASAEFDLKTVLNGISTLYYTQCKDKGIRFVMANDVSDEVLIGDSLRLNQVLLNLVSNAFKFTERGGEIKILTTQTQQNEDEVYIRFTVSDTGCGMSEEMLGRLFMPFEQESAGTAQKHGGSGLGMSIAKNLVELMRGAITVESKVGQGTTFTVCIPFGRSKHTATTDAEKLKSIRALIIDDEPSAREYTSMLLSRIGVAYEEASSGKQALEMLADAHDAGKGYDICFIDWQMPGMDGLDVTREIRKLYNKETVVIIVSAFDLSEVSDQATAAGADLMVSKPLFQSTVFNVLMQLTDGKYVNQTAATEDYDFSGHKVLLAEDNELNAEIAMELLDMVHLAVDRAEDGAKAVSMLENSAPGTYDMILMDMQMPNMDGMEATRTIRAGSHPDAKSIPIYAMTANAFNEDVAAALSCGMNGHIAKPIDTTILYSTIAKVFSEKRATTATGTVPAEK